MNNKIVLVTGCSSGVGLHTAVMLAEQGDTVYATMRDITKAAAFHDVTQQRGVHVNLRQLDVHDQFSISQVVEEIIAHEGRLDVLVNNAGAGCLKGLEEMEFDEVQQVFETNFFGAVRCIRAVMPHMRAAKSGHILNVSSVGGLVGQPLNEIYCAAKFALEGMVESMATYCEPFFNVKLTLIEPAGIKSEFVAKTRAKPNTNTNDEITADYAPIHEAFWQNVTSRGSFESAAQTSAEVAAVIVGAVHQPTADLRIQTSAVAKALADEKLGADPTGVLLQNKIRAGMLGR